MRPRSLTDEEVATIQQCKAERTKLRRELYELTDRSLAKKFEVCPRTIFRIHTAKYPNQV
jgi:hypothetical protein